MGIELSAVPPLNPQMHKHEIFKYILFHSRCRITVIKCMSILLWLFAMAKKHRPPSHDDDDDDDDDAAYGYFDAEMWLSRFSSAPPIFKRSGWHPVSNSHFRLINQRENEISFFIVTKFSVA